MSQNKVSMHKKILFIYGCVICLFNFVQLSPAQRLGLLCFLHRLLSLNLFLLNPNLGREMACFDMFRLLQTRAQNKHLLARLRVLIPPCYIEATFQKLYVLAGRDFHKQEVWISSNKKRN